MGIIAYPRRPWLTHEGYAGGPGPHGVMAAKLKTDDTPPQLPTDRGRMMRNEGRDGDVVDQHVNARENLRANGSHRNINLSGIPFPLYTCPSTVSLTLTCPSRPSDASHWSQRQRQRHSKVTAPVKPSYQAYIGIGCHATSTTTGTNLLYCTTLPSPGRASLGVIGFARADQASAQLRLDSVVIVRHSLASPALAHPSSLQHTNLV